MADIRIKDITTTATSPASDDYLALDGAINGTRKELAIDYAHTKNWCIPQGGYLLDGTDDYISVANNDSLNFGTKNFAIEFYEYLDSRDFNTTYNKTLAKKIDATTGYWVYMYTNSLYVKLATTNYSETLSNLGITASGYYHIVITLSGTSLYIYVNGILKATKTTAGENKSVTVDMYLNGDGSANRYMLGRNILTRFYNKYVGNEITKLWNNGRPELAKLDYELTQAVTTNKITNGTFDTDLSGWNNSAGVTWSSGVASYSALSSGGFYQSPFTFGKRYRLKFDWTRTAGTLTYTKGSYTQTGIINTGTSGSVDIEFVANGNLLNFYPTGGFTGTIDNVEVYQLGCVAEYRPENAGRFGWLETMNRLHGSTNGNPVSLVVGEPFYKDIKLSITGDTTLTNIIPKEYRIKGILINNTTANSVTINIGTSSGGSDVVSAKVCASGLTWISDSEILKKIFSLTTDQTLYVSSTLWNSASLNIEFSLGRF